MKNLGFIASTRSGLSISATDLEMPGYATKNLQGKIDQIEKMVMGDESKVIAAYRELEGELEESYMSGNVLGKDNPVTMFMQSGAKGKANQIRRMSGIVGTGRDMSNKELLPIKRSHLDGLSPQEYWLHSFDSRKGMSDRSLSTAKPGYLTRRIWSATQKTIITELDCGTKDGLMMSIEDKIVGRYAAKTIRSSGGKTLINAGSAITTAIRDGIVKNHEYIKLISVRSPASCASHDGLCGKCYGWEAGKLTPPAIGDPVGVIASQSLGEPATQMTMNTFHGGGNVSNATIGLPRLEEVLNAGTNPKNKSVLANKDGLVKAISQKDLYTEVAMSSGQIYKVTNDIGGNPIELRVKVGDKVRRGDFLTTGNSDDIFSDLFSKGSRNFSSASPQEILDLSEDKMEGIQKARQYLVNGMEHSIKSTLGSVNQVDRKHLELIVGSMTELGKVLDSSTSSYMPGQEVKLSDIDKWNTQNSSTFSAKELSLGTDSRNIIGAVAARAYRDSGRRTIVREGEEITKEIFAKLSIAGHRSIKVTPKDIRFEPLIKSINTSPSEGHDNWLSNLGHSDVSRQLSRGVAYGQIDTLSDPRGRLMAGKLVNVGEGYNILKKNKNKANSFATNLLNLFR